MCLLRNVYIPTLERNLFFCLQVYLLIIILPIVCGAKLDAVFEPTHFRSVEEPVLINFPKRINLTRTTAQRFYLPQEIPSNLLPEVIDNRLRSFSWVDFHKPSQPDLGLQASFKSDQKDSFYKFRPNHTLTKHMSDSNSQDLISELVQVNEMACRNSGQELYFRVSLKPLKSTGQPIIENTGSENCLIEKLEDEYKIDFGNSQFWNCGVVDCFNESENNYCLTLRFPLITGLKLKDDFKLTLKCKSQDKTVSHVKKISLNTLDTTARMAPRVEAGGHKNDFQTDVALYRKTYNSENIFDTRIESGGTVALGEEILLRVLVREGDGWQYSKINDVTVHFVERKRRKNIMNSLWILDANGCLNPQVRTICSREQYRVSPLESYLLFQAFMFENMKESDEMILSVKVTGCLDGVDCILNCPAGHVRSKRNLQNNRNQTIKWENDVTFKVVLLKTMEKNSLDLNLVIPYALSALILMAAGILIYLVKRVGRQRFSRYSLS